MLFAVHFSAESENAQRCKSSYEYRWFKTAFEVKCIKTTYSMFHERFGIKSRLIIDPNLMIDGRNWAESDFVWNILNDHWMKIQQKLCNFLSCAFKNLKYLRVSSTTSLFIRTPNLKKMVFCYSFPVKESNSE